MNHFLDTSNFLTKSAKKYLGKDTEYVVKKLLVCIKTVKSINTANEYNNIVQKIVKLFKNEDLLPRIKSPLFEKEIVQISKSAPLTEKTVWGGVSLKKVDVGKNFIKKLLVIGQYGILGFEIHKQKHERLKILEGVCIVLFSNHADPNWKKGKISVRLAAPGDKFEFLPNDEHGIIALTNAVIEEKSTNYLDDLVYIFKAS